MKADVIEGIRALMRTAAIVLLLLGFGSCTLLNETILARFGFPVTTTDGVSGEPGADRDQILVTDDAARSPSEKEPAASPETVEEAKAGETDVPKQSVPEKDLKKPKAEPEKPKDLSDVALALPERIEELLMPAIQLSIFAMSLDHYPDFVLYNIGFFEYYLYTVFQMENTPYSEGQGTILSSPAEDRGMVLEKALLSREEDGSTWWQVWMEQYSQQMAYEALISPAGIPLKILYKNPETEEIYEYIPYLAGQYREALAGGWVDSFLDNLRRELQDRWEQEWQLSFNAPELVGEVDVRVPAGDFRAFHIQDDLEWGIRMDYWISPQVPGGIIRIHETQDDEDPVIIAELMSVGRGYESRYTGSELIPIDAFTSFLGEETLESEYTSEGSEAEPIPVPAETGYQGTVGPEEISYYSFTPGRRADIYIEVFDLAGNAELTYYGTDSTFTDWVSASTGGSLGVEDYYVEAGTVVYFSVADIVDPMSQGEGYTVSIYENPILSPTGIMIRGEIYDEAEEVKAEKPLKDTLGRESLKYYRAAVDDGNHLKIRCEDLPNDAELIWFDTEGGGYSEAYTSYEGSTIQIDVKGLSAGTICYFYVVGDPVTTDRKKRFTLTVSEISD